MAEAESCGCKGIRSCFICEGRKSDAGYKTAESSQPTIYTYCSECCIAFQETSTRHPEHHSNSMPFKGITILQDFISKEEEDLLQDHIYKAPFVLSQSGRRKQDFGPKVNFKKKKLRADKFSGLPSYAKFLYDRMQTHPELSDFLPVELCNLEYCADRGAAIDPHFDDFWLWGERLVTVNLLSDSLLSFTSDALPLVEVHVPLFRRSLIVVRGDARNVWKHGIHRHHITGTRIATTLRELTPEFLEGGERAEEGRSLLDVALRFQGISVAES
ncbi:alpha-ketoglutarate-dependent dioxygenase alkB homolog 4-like [Babylonia areolata]|uniref:alpha-ketoglutarate-dependent dioxygenase alkB homolog 4-like n=1 Tax=Babylonia areolata TaxID=304850 RepID=UPI003FD3360F